MAGGAPSVVVVDGVEPGPAAVVVVAVSDVEPIVVEVVAFDVVVVAMACCVVPGDVVPGIGDDEGVVPGPAVVEIGTWVETVTTPRPKTENR